MLHDIILFYFVLVSGLAVLASEQHRTDQLHGHVSASESEEDYWHDNALRYPLYDTSISNSSNEVGYVGSREPIFYDPTGDTRYWKPDHYKVISLSGAEQVDWTADVYTDGQLLLNPAHFVKSKFYELQRNRKKMLAIRQPLYSEEELRPHVDKIENDEILNLAMRHISLLDETHGAVNVRCKGQIYHNSRMTVEEAESLFRDGKLPILDLDASTGLFVMYQAPAYRTRD